MTRGDDIPSHFFPGAASPEQAEQYREAIVRFARDNGFPASPRRIFRICSFLASAIRESRTLMRAV